jgi:hypothetical protein
VVEARDSAPDIAWRGGFAFGLDGQIPDHLDAFARLDVLKGDPGRPPTLRHGQMASQLHPSK